MAGLDTLIRNPSASPVLVRYPAHGGRKRSKRRVNTAVWQPGQVSTPRVRFNLDGMSEEDALEILKGSELPDVLSRRGLVIDGDPGVRAPPSSGPTRPPEPIKAEPYSTHAEKVLSGENPPPLPSLTSQGVTPEPAPPVPSLPPLPSSEEVEVVAAPSDGGAGEPDASWALDDLVAYCESNEIPLTAQARRSKPKVLRAISENR